MTRLVRTAEGIQIDPTGKIAGRGAYLHNLQSCWEAGLKGPLARALKTEISTNDRNRLELFLKSLTDETGNAADM